MARIIPQIASFITVTSSTVILLAVAVGWLIPTGQQIAFASARGWRPGPWELQLLDVERAISQRVATSDTRSNPGLPITWSPDGKTIAYLNYVENHRTFLLNSLSGKQLLLNGLDIPDAYNVIWSPDGRKFAFVGGIGNQHIYVADVACIDLPEGCTPYLQRLTQRSGGYVNLSWSPDSRRLAFEFVDVHTDIYVMDMDCPAHGRCETHLHNITHHEGRDMKPVWSPDGRWIAFMSNRENYVYYDLYIAQVDDSDNMRQLTENSPGDSGWVMHWSPDGRKLLFGSAAWTGGDDLYLIDLLTYTIRNITQDNGRDANASWSPDGRWITFESTATGSWDIYMVDASGENRRRLTNGRRYNNRLPSWSPDSQRIAFISNAVRSWDIYTVRLLENGTTSAPVRLTANQGLDFNPVWRPG